MSLPAIVTASLWLAWLAYWGVAARGAKPILRRESAGSRALHVGPLFICALLLVEPRIVMPSVLVRRFLPDQTLLRWVGVAVVAGGLSFAVWARRHLAGNWSGAVVLKAGHSLVRSGPYALVRHPIYAGLLLAVLGSALELGELRGLLALACAVVSVTSRVLAEDALMAATFGAEYREYRQRTPALLPFSNLTTHP
jgi:protein-S-isoprenylcysteine O-methyltransferase Ste14